MIKVLGYEFREMMDSERMCFAGAEAGTLISEITADFEHDGRVLLYEPATQTLAEIWTDADGNARQRNWVPEEIL